LLLKKTALTCFIGVALFIPAVPYAQESVTPDQVVGAIEKQFGVTSGQRRNHINGVCVAGSFVGNKSVQAYTTSPLFSGKTIPVIGRFSLAGGGLKIPDTARNPRGMALEFELPKQDKQHFTMLNVPVFGAATPSSFYDGVLANTPDPATGKPDPEKVASYKATHPDAQALGEYLARNNPVASYANSDFYSVHTFRFMNKSQQTTLVKWRFVPEDGVKRLTDEELKTTPTRFLDQDIMAKTKAGPVRWQMMLVIGEPGDEQTNPTIYWPANRKEIKAGVLTLSSASPQQGGACEKINFDPLVMTLGIAPTNDPVLLFRSPAYADSYAKRMTGQ
jgi:catalase